MYVKLILYKTINFYFFCFQPFDDNISPIIFYSGQLLTTPTALIAQYTIIAYFNIFGPV